MRSRFLPITALGVLACLAAPSPAARADTEVPLARAALVDPAAVEALYDAVEQAARRECRKAGDHLTALSPSVRRMAIERCAADTVDAAVQSIDAPELTARHENGVARPSLLAARR